MKGAKDQYKMRSHRCRTYTLQSIQEEHRLEESEKGKGLLLWDSVQRAIKSQVIKLFCCMVVSLQQQDEQFVCHYPPS